jgi:tetratricopeptide (TPR) repeat protein
MRSLLGWLLATLLFVSAGTPARAAWHEAKSRHFIIYADAPAELLQDYAERLERFDQAVRRLRSMPDPSLADASKVKVYVVGDREALERLIGIEGAAGMYVGRASGAVAFVPELSRGKMPAWALDSQTVFFHEYMHHLQLQGTTAMLPPWVVEGTAEFFSTAKIEDDGSVGIGAAPGHRALGLYLSVPIPLEELVGVTYKRLNSVKRETLYGRGWLLTHYLNFEPSRRGQLDKYLSNIQNGQEPLVAAQAAFGDLDVLDREVERYMSRKRFTYVVVPASELKIEPAQIRPLRAGEAAIMRVKIRSDRGVSSRSAAGVVVDARKVAERHGDDPAVQAALAEAEYDADNVAGAIAAADRALALDPNSRQALMYKGLALMKRGRENPDKANWADVRSLFTKANRLDPDDAWPLLTYYQSFYAAKDKPTANAAKGLIYAAQLVPQDDRLRILATRQFLIDNKPAFARQMYATIAYDAHASVEAREKRRLIMDAIVAGDSRAALALLDPDYDKEDATARR